MKTEINPARLQNIDPRCGEAFVVLTGYVDLVTQYRLCQIDKKGHILDYIVNEIRKDINNYEDLLRLITDVSDMHDTLNKISKRLII